MSTDLPQVYLARHGETAWSLSGQHTGRTDLPLTARGEANARRLGKLIGPVAFDQVWTSPLQRARQTCELAGFAEQAETVHDLVEWDYGNFEGLTTAEIRRAHPKWQLFRDGCPGGESPVDVGLRADGVIGRLRTSGGCILAFSSGHFLRVLGARWLGLEPAAGRLLLLSTATLSIVGYEHSLAEPVLRLWNDDRHVDGTRHEDEQKRR